MHGVQIVGLRSWNIRYDLLLYYEYIHFTSDLSCLSASFPVI
jgi:hypothetical protein